MGIGDTGRPAQVFGRRQDAWTTRALDLCERANLAVEFVDLDAPENELLTAKLVGETRRYQTPYVFVGGQFIGGFAELDERERLGLLAAAPPRAGRSEVVIVQRQGEFTPPALSGPPRPPAEHSNDEDDEDSDYNTH